MHRWRAIFTLGKTRTWPAALCVAVAAALVAGCGVTTTQTGGGGGGPTPTSTSPTHGTTVRACPGPLEAVTIGSPALVLTPKTPNRTGSAQVGEPVVVELPMTNRWSLNTQASSLAHLTAQAQQGVQDSNTNTCVWIWHAQSAGMATISFTGTALCESNVPCPAYAVLEEFTVTIS